MIDQLLSSNVYQALVNASSPSAINPYITASVITSGYVPYTGATANVNLGAFSLTTPLIIGGSAVSSTIQYKGTSGNGTSTVAAHEFLVGNNGATSTTKIYNSGQVSIGNYASPTNLRILTIGQDTAYMTFGSLVGSTNYCALYFNQSAPSVTNYGIIGTTNETYLNTEDVSFGASVGVRINNSSRFLIRGNSTTGAVTTFTLTNSTHTGQTASTNIPGFLFTTGSRQWATGAITAQEEIRITSPTYSFVGASTITNAYTLFVNSPTAGTNATITNNYALGTSGDAQFIVGTSTAGIKLQGLVGGTTQGTIYINQATPSSTNYSITADTATTILNGVTSFDLKVAAISKLLVTGVTATGATTGFSFTAASNTNQTLSTEISGYLYNSYSRQWATGAINTQRERYYKTVTYSFASASTITNAYGAYFEAPTAGTNATITNNYAAGFSGAIQVTNNTTQIDDFTGGVSGPKRLRLRNSGGSATSFAQIDAENNGSIISSLGVTSGAYTGTGVLTSNTHFFIAQNGTAGNSVLYGANSVSMRIKFINGGFATSNVAFEIDNNNNIICGNAALATNATDGFLYLPSCAGTPTGTPTTVTGRVPVVVDSTNNKFYFYSGSAWVPAN